MTLAFTVYGVAVPKGSTRAFVPKGWTRPIITDTNRNTNSWAQLVAEGASRAIADADHFEILRDAVRLTVGFYLPRPKKYQRRGLPVAHLKKPDVDKLVRGVLDALTSVAWLDDSQVVELVAVKQYADVDDPPRVTILVEATAGVRPLAVPAAPHSLFEVTR